ncbi:MAG: M36 family metallopeptidase [Thermoanaerobaculia bacterium]
MCEDSSAALRRFDDRVFRKLRRNGRLLLAALALTAGSIPAGAEAPVPGGRTLPENFDVRALATSPERSTLSARELAAARDLELRAPGLRITRDEGSMLPVSIRSTRPGESLAGAAGEPGAETVSAESVARDFLSAHRDLYAATAADLAALELRYVSYAPGGATIVKFDAFAGRTATRPGTLIFDSELAVAMTADLSVTAVVGRLRLESASAVARFDLSPQQAISIALADLAGIRAPISEFVPIVEPSEAPEAAASSALSGAFDPYGHFELSRDLLTADPRIFERATRVRPVLFPLAVGRFVAAHYLELWVNGPAGDDAVFSYVISAEDGSVLFRKNLRQDVAFSYQVFAATTGPHQPSDGPTGTTGSPHPTGLPDGFQPPFVSSDPVSIESLIGPSDPWLASTATQTTGNNADAYLDLGGINGFDGGDVRGALTAPGTFGAVFDPTLDASDTTNRQAAVVGMFYDVNWLHDIWYSFGFDELSGNAQTDNYGRGGAGNDAVLAEGQDHSGLDNANIAVPADGSKARMQLFVFSAGGSLAPTRDSTIDMTVLTHEIAHVMSGRLIGNANGLNNAQGLALNEGWADFESILVTTQATDVVAGTTIAVGGYTFLSFCPGYVDNFYFGLRRFPYSTNREKNALTFKDIGPGYTLYPGVAGNPCISLTADPAEKHNAGEIWANMLWEGFVQLAQKHGLLAARNRIQQYVIDGMKLTPTQPTFTQARDGVLDAVASGAHPDDERYLLRAFAKRGMGSDAVSPVSGSVNNSGIVEDFMPFFDDFETGDTGQWSRTTP